MQEYVVKVFKHSEHLKNKLKQDIKETLDRVSSEDENYSMPDLYNVLRWSKKGYLQLKDF